MPTSGQVLPNGDDKAARRLAMLPGCEPPAAAAAPDVEHSSPRHHPPPTATAAAAAAAAAPAAAAAAAAATNSSKPGEVGASKIRSKCPSTPLPTLLS